MDGHSASSSQRSDRDLTLAVARAQSGHLESLDRVLRAIQLPLQRHVRMLVNDVDLADDVLQDVLWTIARRLPQLRDPRWFRPWAYRIATRAALRRTRAERRWREALRDEELSLLEAPHEDLSFDAETFHTIVEQVDSLSPASSVVMRLHYVEEMTHQEIAEALEIAVGTVKSRLVYGLSTLRRRLNV